MPQRPSGQQAQGAVPQTQAQQQSKTQATFEISQAKVAKVIGKGGAVLNAIKKYSKAECFVEQRTPDPEHARVTAIGSQKEVAKCQQTVKALVGEKMSLATLGSLSGVTGLQEGLEDSGQQASQPAGAPSIPGLQLPGAPPSLLAALRPPGNLPPPPHLAAAALTAQVPGMPENTQMQQNLNDYYARMWTSYSLGEDPESKDDRPKEQPMAFDPEALKRLAERAQAGDIEEPRIARQQPPPPPEETDFEPPAHVPMSERPLSTQLAMGQGSLEERAVAEVECILGVTGNNSLRQLPSSDGTKPAAAEFTGPLGFSPGAGTTPQLFGQASAPVAQVTPGSAAPMTFGNTQRKMPELTLKGFLRPGGFDDDVPQTKKDADSVNKMLERLQGNVTQTKEAVGMQPQVPSQPMMGHKAAFEAGPEDTRTQADFHFENMISRAQAANDQESLDNIAREMLIRFPAFTPQQIADLVQKMESMPALRDHQGSDFLAELCRLLGSRLREVTSTQFTAICAAVAAWSADPKRRRAQLFAQLSKMYFTAAANEMSSRLMTFAPQELNSCLAAFVSVGFSEHKFFASVGRAALARHSSFAPVQLVALLAILSEMRLVHTDLFNAAAGFLTTRAKELRPVDIIRVMRSFAKCNVRHQGLCTAVSDEVVTRTRNKTTIFKAEDLCEISWALCVLEHFNGDLLKCLFKGLEKAPMIGSDALTLLFEAHLSLEFEHREAYGRFASKMSDDMIDALQDHYRETRKDERRCTEERRKDVASILKSLVDGSVHVNHRTSCGLLIDVAALRKRSSTDGFVHVDLDSNVTSIRSLDQDDPASAGMVIEGAVALRRRILQKQGLRLVTVRESEWRDMDDTKEKRRYLRNLLAAFGDVLE
eukprot:TRINITY_DN18473_c1_g1_i2.p1 TRINITY_DN18473_c1_g1~~TRINITY_DN18473_c1_g1_i2.p1  ORF type:complete len:938 (-),score=206.24 TRINITY_DN18473_c1_g1_i2:14-2647(-)